MRYSRKERKLPAKSKNVAVLQIKVKTTWLASNSSKPFPVRKKVRTLQFWTKKGKNFHWSEKRLQLAWWSCKQAKTFFAEKKPWQQRNLVTKQQKHSLQWYKVTIMVITCKKTSVWSSASASTWNLFCSWSMKAVFTLRSRSFSTSECCPPLRLDMVFLSFSFTVVLLSLPAAAPLLTRASGSDRLHIPVIIRWSIWFLSLPLNEY